MVPYYTLYCWLLRTGYCIWLPVNKSNQVYQLAPTSLLKLDPFIQPNGNNLSGKYFCHYSYFPPALFLFCVVYFSYRWSAHIKKLISHKLIEAPKNIGLNSFSSPVGHFLTVGRPFHVFLRNPQKNFWAKVDWRAQKPFQTLSDILSAPGGHFGFWRLCAFAVSAPLQAVSKYPWRH